MAEQQTLEQQFRERFRAAREARNLTQAEVAAIVGMQQQTIAKIEKGTRPIQLDEIEPLADALGVYWRELFMFGVPQHSLKELRELREAARHALTTVERTISGLEGRLLEQRRRVTELEQDYKRFEAQRDKFAAQLASIEARIASRRKG